MNSNYLLVANGQYKVQQAVILAGGESSRFMPLSANRHKSKIPLLGKSLINRTIGALVDCGIRNIIVVHAPGRRPILGKKNKTSVSFVVQKEPKGMGNALLSAEEYLEDCFFVTHAYHFDCGYVLKSIAKSVKRADGVMLLRKPAKGKVGIAQTRGDRVISVAEKPYKGEKNTYNISGLYILSRKYIDLLKKQKEGHYSFESALDGLAKNHALKAYIYAQELLTLKYPWDLLDLKDFLLKNIKSFRHSSADIHKTSVIDGEVYIDKNASIGAYSIIRGPAYIGRGVFVGDHCLLRNSSVIEEGVMIGAYAEVKNSVILENTHVHGYIADSILGENVRLAHGFISANKRFDKKRVSVLVKGRRVDTGRVYFGTVIGDNSSFGIKTATLPGVAIGENSVIGPGTIVFENIAANYRCYKSQKLVRKE
jgi:bifunctional UDP-N-acetylglucosamine pyrophosphorylase/glucosamine-1-phosphate N-acetyltransferase